MCLARAARRLPIAALAVVLFGQTAPTNTTAEMTQQDSAPTFQSKVNLVLVPVVVRDAQGKPIGGLTKDSFQLFDKGKLQTISAFSVVKRAAEATKEAAAGGEKSSAEKPAGVASPERFAAYLFDDLHMEVGDLMQLKKAASAHLENGLQASDRAAIYTTSGRTQLEFTDDRAKLQETLTKIKAVPMYGPSGVRQCPNITYYLGDLIVNKNDQQALDAATSETLICMNMDTSQMQQAQSIAQNAARQALTIGEQGTRVSLSVIRDVIRRLASMPGQRVIILASPGFLTQSSEAFSTKTEILDRAARANVMISALDARGLFTGEMDASQQGAYSSQNQQLISRYFRDSAMANEDVLAEMAEGTGGTFFHNSNDLVGGFKRIAAAPEFSYMLGFSPQSTKPDSSFHRLKVTVNERGYGVQARRGYYAAKHSGSEADDVKTEIEEAVFSREELRDIPVDVRTQFFKPDPADAKLTVLTRVDLRRLRFKKADGRNNDKLTVVAAVFDNHGNFISALTKTVDMHLRDETLARLGSGITVRTNFDIKPGTYVVRLVVRDDEGNAMAAQNAAVDIP